MPGSTRHQGNIKACHLSSFISLPPSRTSRFSSPVPFMHLYTHQRPNFIPPSSRPFYSPESVPLCSSCSHTSPNIVVSCKTRCLAQQNDNSPERRLQHPRHSTMTEHHWPTASYGLQSTFARDIKQCNRWCLGVSSQRTRQEHMIFTLLFRKFL